MCRKLKQQTIDMALNYINSVDDENFLTGILLGRDYFGRDSLRISMELELLDLIQKSKVEAVIKMIYNSDYAQTGDLMDMSTSY